MSSLLALVATGGLKPPAGLEEAFRSGCLSCWRRVVVVDSGRELLENLECSPPDLAVIERSCWYSMASRISHPLGGLSRLTPVLLYAPCVDAEAVRQAIGYGARGCVREDAIASQWLRAIEAVRNGEIAMPREALAQALHKELEQRPRPLPARPELDDVLTDRENEVLRCVTAGMSNKQIGRMLGISDTTVKTHLHHVFGKLGIGRRALLMVAPSSPVAS